jgi:hypothetical protein
MVSVSQSTSDRIEHHRGWEDASLLVVDDDLFSALIPKSEFMGLCASGIAAAGSKQNVAVYELRQT